MRGCIVSAQPDFATLPEQVYRNDPSFRAIVDMLESMIHQAQFSPHEVRSAAMLAVIHYEMRRPLSIRVTQRDDGTFDIHEER